MRHDGNRSSRTLACMPKGGIVINRFLPLLRTAMYALRGGFLVRPLLISITLGLLGAVFSSLEEDVPVLSAWVPSFLFPSRADPQVAQIILATIAGSIMTVVSIVFAILLMTLTLASMQFSPRILLSFVQDRVTQWTLGIFLGTFAYCMAALPAARSFPHPFAPVATVTFAMVLAVICVAWLVFFIYHISQAISVNHIVDRIARDTERVIDDIMSYAKRYAHEPAGVPFDDNKREIAVDSAVSGYIRYVDSGRLLYLARAFRLRVRILRRVGHFVPQGVALFEVSPQERLDPERTVELRSAFDIGPARTMQQDVEFGVIQIVDIALKAISSAVNDPSTAITCVDQLGRILIRFVNRHAPVSLLCDPPHVVRVIVPWIGTDSLLDTAFEQIRHYSMSDIAVSLRLLRALDDIASTCSDPRIVESLIGRGRRIVGGCAERLGSDEVEKLKQRLGALEARGV
ncbi:MAG: DUF2254 domain-containing protein [Steroidobacteraceae bacterium]